MSSSAPQTTAPNTIGISGFFTDPGFDFVTRSLIGYAAQGVMDVGQVFATIARVKDGSADSWYAAWRETAEKLHGQAKASLAAGHTATAHRLFLAASEGYAQAVAFLDGQTDKTTFTPTFALQTECWEAFIDTSDGRIERVAVPYERHSLPGFLFRPDRSDAKRPTVVMTNGSEGSKSGLWAWGVSSTLARGWNAFIYDGPGQQNMLFDKEHPFRPDWEAVLTPVVDALTARGDVDGSTLFAYGCSQAGYWVTRALAFEHRFVAAVVDPGVMDVSASWLSNIPPTLVAVLKAGKKDEFNAAMALAAKNPKMAEVIAARGRPFAKPTVYDTFKAAMEYNLREVIGQVKTPLLITDPDEETF
jgi:dienelactone hydrolase